ncbi:MAG TPA: hypothetical protein VKV17_05415 [Bryobacteraceae bacterium]|nr:hypothetical protein [Bryobacteraceae bacterium]
MKTRLLAAGGIAVLALFTVAAAYRNTYGTDRPVNNNLYLGPGAAGPPTGPVEISGILVDAGCADRSQENLVRTPAPLNFTAPAEYPEEAQAMNEQRTKTGFAGKAEPQSPAVQASGISVDQKTLAQEQADVLEHQARDLYSRQPDNSCGITADTSSFALLTDQGRLLNLDQGGNTWAWQAVQSTAEGRALLNGMGPSFKPRVTIKGEVVADRLVVEHLTL